jgi:hypothetical protein
MHGSIGTEFGSKGNAMKPPRPAYYSELGFEIIPFGFPLSDDAEHATAWLPDGSHLQHAVRRQLSNVAWRR